MGSLRQIHENLDQENQENTLLFFQKRIFFNSRKFSMLFMIIKKFTELMYGPSYQKIKNKDLRIDMNRIFGIKISILQ